MGNASCLRNEKVGGGSFQWTPEFVLPHIGRFECDFMYLAPNRPQPSEALNEEEVIKLLSWFQEKHAYFM